MWIELLILLSLLWISAFLFLGRLEGLPQDDVSTGATDRDDEALTLSVIIPARNEADTLPGLLRSLDEQQQPADEIIVVDDESDDETGAVARAFGVRVEQPSGDAADWLGKPRACWTGAHAARGDLLLFLDADTVLAPDALSRLRTAWRKKRGLVSVQPYHAMQRPYERLSAFFNIVLMAAIRSFSILGGRLQPHGSFGPCMLVSAADYHRSGGHATVKREVLEDVALARVMSAQSIPVTNYVGRETLRFRMYGGGIGDVVTGWTKNFARGAIATGPVLILLIAGWITGSGIAARFPVEAAIVAGRAAVGSGADLAVVPDIAQEWPVLIVGVAAYAAYVLQIRWLLRRIGNFGILTALFYPVPLAFFTAVFLRSLYRTLVRKSVTWKGREIQITSSDAPTDTGAGPGDKPSE